MSDLKELASKARSTLSQALEALQAGDDVPEKLIEAAAPIAKSMGVLHRVEKNGTATQEEVDGALANVRSVLDSLQEIGENHPAVDAAMEAVAGSLSKLFALSKAVKSAPAAKKAEPEPARKPEPKPEPAPKAQPAPQAEPAPKSVRKPEPKAEPAPKSVRKPEPKAEPAPKSVRKPAPAPTEEPAPRSLRRSERSAARTAEPAAPPAAPSKDKEVVPGAERAPLPSADARVLAVELGAHSGSNFYKGLSGNDVIEHGGLFVATYKIPPAGQPVALRVHLPGDLEFEADAIVQWTRDVSGEETDPGFGAKFTRISGEARQLVYRYVRNREPMFYDDL